MKLAPIPDHAWPPEIESMRAGFAGRLDVYRVMAHNPALLASWESFRNHIVLTSALSAQEREIAILRGAHLWNVGYEWTHHVERGHAAGLSDADIAAVQRGADDPLWAPPRRALILAVDGLVKVGKIAPDVLDLVAAHFSKAQVLDIIATIGLYRTLACLIATFEVPLEPDLVR